MTNGRPQAGTAIHGVLAFTNAVYRPTIGARELSKRDNFKSVSAAMIKIGAAVKKHSIPADERHSVFTDSTKGNHCPLKEFPPADDHLSLIRAHSRACAADKDEAVDVRALVD